MRNPGRMLISVDDFYAGSQSLCRNPILQKIFMFLGYGEKAGSGADPIVKGWQDNKWGRPVIEEKVQPDTVTLTLNIKGLTTASQEVPQDVPQTVPQDDEIKSLILERMEKNPKITTAELSRTFYSPFRPVAFSFNNFIYSDGIDPYSSLKHWRK